MSEFETVGEYMEHAMTEAGLDTRTADKREIAALRQHAEAMAEALKSARHFIINGVELGFIRMPDPETPDPAHQTLPMIEACLSAYRAESAGKGGA